MAKKAKKKVKKAAKKASKKAGKKVAKKAGSATAKKATKKAGKKAAKKKSRRTVMYSSGGKKLYAVRSADGQFKDIQQYARAHRADIARTSKAEQAAEMSDMGTGTAGM